MRVVFTTSPNGRYQCRYSGKVFQWRNGQTHTVHSRIVTDRFLAYPTPEIAAVLTPLHYCEQPRIYWLAEGHEIPSPGTGILSGALFFSHLKTINVFDIRFFHLLQGTPRRSYMPRHSKYYVTCGMLRHVCEASNYEDAALRAFRTLQTKPVKNLSHITIVSEQGFIDDDDCHESDVTIMTVDLLEQTGQSGNFAFAEWL